MGRKKDCVLFSEVEIVQGYLALEEVSCLEKCPQFRGVLI